VSRKSGHRFSTPLVAAGLGVAIAPHSLSQVHADGVCFLPINGEQPPANIALAYRRGDRSRAVRNFVAVALKQKQLWDGNMR